MSYFGKFDNYSNLLDLREDFFSGGLLRVVVCFFG